jgi:hypothetical protein
MTVHEAPAPGESTLPAASVERTRAVWKPRPRPDTTYELVHGAQAPSSRRHCELAPASSTAKPMLAEVPRVISAGADVIVVCGAVVSPGGGGVESLPGPYTWSAGAQVTPRPSLVR